jgi:class 3 adenylate cyclase
MAWLAALVAVAALVLVAWRARRVTTDLERRLAGARRELQALQAAFARFVPARVVDEIVADGISTHTEKKDVTVLFADLKGFTALSEAMAPADLVTVLNGYLQCMSAVIVEHRGHVSELIGDGILALFGALETNPWQTNDAVHAALAMRAALADYNATLAAAGHPPLALSIGIHRGPVVAGVIGSAGMLKYGVIGLTVNLAARVESLTRTHAVDVLVTDATRAALDHRFRLRALPSVAVKGIAEPVATFAVDGFDAAEA